MTRQNYRYANAKCCGTCRHCLVASDGNTICAHGIKPAEMGYNDLVNWQRQQEPIDPDHICDSYKSEVEE